MIVIGEITHIIVGGGAFQQMTNNAFIKQNRKEHKKDAYRKESKKRQKPISIITGDMKKNRNKKNEAFNSVGKLNAKLQVLLFQL